MSAAVAEVVPVFSMADRIRKARETAGLTQDQLADRAGVSRRSVSNYEAGTTRPRRPQLVVIAMATGVPVKWLETGQA